MFSEEYPRPCFFRTTPIAAAQPVLTVCTGWESILAFPGCGMRCRQPGRGLAAAPHLKNIKPPERLFTMVGRLLTGRAR